MIFSRYVALDISSTEIRAVAVSMGKIKKWASAPLPRDVVKAGLIRDTQTLGVIIDSLFRIYRMNKDRVIATVTGLPFIYRTVSMPGGQRIPTEAIERESRREMSIAKDDMYISWQATESHSESGEVDYFVVGIPRASLNPVLEALKAAGIKPLSIDIKPLALARAAARPEALIVSLEEDYVDIVLVAAGMVRVIHSFNLSEKAASAGNLVNEIVAGLTRAIKAFERDFPHLALTPETAVLFSGNISPDDTLLDRIGEAIGREVQYITSALAAPAGMSVGTYIAVLGLVSKTRSPKKEPAAYRSYSDTKNRNGLISPGVYRDITIDLLAGFRRVHPSRFQMVFVVAALISLVLAALVYKSFDMKQDAALEVASLQEEASAITHRLNMAQTENQASLAARQDSLNRSQNISQQLESINRLNTMINGRRLDFAARITAIADAVPDDAEFFNIEFFQDKIKVTGAASNGFAVLNMVDDLEENPYFDSVRLEQLSPDKAGGVYYNLTITGKTTVMDLSGGKVQ